MKIIVVLLLSFWSTFILSAEKNAYQNKITFLCSQVSQSPQLKYESNFSDEFRKQVKAEIMLDILSSIHKKNGRCKYTKMLQSSFDPNIMNRYSLVLENQKNAVFEIYLNDQSQIAGLLYKGLTDPSVTFELTETMVSMRDEIKLRTFIYTGKEQGTKPVVLLRTPYLILNNKIAKVLYDETAKYFIKRGYHFVLQAIRGTHGSEGSYKYIGPLEINDGYDTIDWIVAQSFSNGKVAIQGTSYDGFTSLAAGISNHPALKLVMAGGAPSNIATDAFNFNGVLTISLLDYIRYNQTGAGPIWTPNLKEKAAELVISNPALEEYDEILFGVDLSEWNLIAQNYSDTAAPFWKEREIFSRLKEINVPTYHIAGMEFDGDMPDTVRNFMEVDRNSPYKKRHHLILGYWGHGNSTPYRDGSNMAPFIKERFDAIMDFYLKDIDTPYASEARVRVASNISKNFLSSDTFPIPTLKKETFFISSSSEQLTLSKKNSYKTTSSTYSFSPFRINDFKNSVQNIFIEKKIEHKINLLGPATFDLYLSIDTPQTDIMSVIYKLKKDGKEVFISNCLPARKVYNDQSIMRLTYDSCPILGTFEKGETLGVLITSNLFPLALRNRNNEIENFFSNFSDANITLHHSVKYQSKITLTIE